jgi:sec-independent protein translocase protein TatA
MELMVILLVLLLLFGPSRLAGLGAAAGRTIREFRKAMSEVEEEIKNPRPSHPDGEPRPPGA